jgi:hypothetical protein
MSTIRMVRELKPAEIGVSVSYPLPGTAFFDTVMAGRPAAEVPNARWSGSMENRLLFASPFPQGFYDAAREVLRTEHALARFVSQPTVRRLVRLPWHLGRWPVERAKVWALGRS